MDTKMRNSVLVVDDSPQNIGLVMEVLKEHYRLIVAISGEKALQILGSGQRPDLILLDVMMPRMDGYEVISILKKDKRFSAIPVIFLTASGDFSDQKKGLDMGAVDYVTKPFNPALLLARVNNHVMLKAAMDDMRQRATVLEDQIQQQTNDIEAVQEAVLVSLASLAECHSHEKSGHINRTKHMIVQLARTLRKKYPKYGHLPDDYSRKLFLCAQLHDIGMLGVPDRIILKKEPLTGEEIKEIRKHSYMGAKALLHADRVLKVNLDFIGLARELCLNHHERWDGKGYPAGLAGEKIPLAGRLMHIVDTYEALTSERAYRAPMTHRDAVSIIRDGRGSAFDPDICDAFLSIDPQIESITHDFVQDYNG